MYKRSEKGCLVIHGLTAMPVIMKPVIDGLVRAGFEVNTPLLPGHGTDVSDLAVTNWGEWWSAVTDAYHELRQGVKKVSCVGLSLGSLLALRLAEEVRWGIRAVVAMGTPLVLSWPIEYLAYPLVCYTPIRWFYKMQNKDWEHSVADPVGRRAYVQGSYEKMPIHAVMEIMKLKRVVSEGLKNITMPIFVIHGRGDRTAPLKNMRLIREGVCSNMVEELILPRSRHVVTLDYDKDLVVNTTVSFLKRFT